MNKHQFTEITEYQAQQQTSEQGQTIAQASQQENSLPSEIGNLDKNTKNANKKGLRLAIAAAGIAAAIASSVIATGASTTSTANLETTLISTNSIAYVAYLPEDFENIVITLSNAKVRKSVKPTQQNYNGEFNMLEPETVYTLTVQTANWQNTTLHKKNFKTAKVSVAPPYQDLSDGKITKITFQRDYSTKILHFAFTYQDPNNYLTSFTAKLLDASGNTVLQMSVDKENADSLFFSFADVPSGNYLIEISAISTKNNDLTTTYLRNNIRI